MRLGSAQRLEGRNRVLGLEERLAPVTREPGMRFERARGIAANAEHHTRVVAGAAEQKREHGGAAEAAVSPDPSAPAQDPVDVMGEMRRGNALSSGRYAREPREGAIGREELERARHGRACHHDLELRAQTHASEQERRSRRAAAMHHFAVYEGTFASADTSK
jgi:hypothetical protein